MLVNYEYYKILRCEISEFHKSQVVELDNNQPNISRSVKILKHTRMCTIQ